MIVLLWQAGWNRITSRGKPSADQHVHALLLHHVAADDPHVEPGVDLLLQRVDQELEVVEVVAGAAEVDVLVLEPHALLRRLDQRQDVLRVVVRREQRLDLDLAVEPQRLEELRRLGELDRLLVLLRARTGRAATNGSAAPAAGASARGRA